MPSQTAATPASWFQYIDLGKIGSYASTACLMAFGYQLGGDACGYAFDDCTPPWHKAFAVAGMVAGFFGQGVVDRVKYSLYLKRYTELNLKLEKQCNDGIPLLITACKLPLGARGPLQANLEGYLGYCEAFGKYQKQSLSAQLESYRRLDVLNERLGQFTRDVGEAGAISSEFFNDVTRDIKQLFIRNTDDDIHQALSDDAFLAKLINQQVDTPVSLST